MFIDWKSGDLAINRSYWKDYTYWSGHISIKYFYIAWYREIQKQPRFWQWYLECDPIWNPNGTYTLSCIIPFTGNTSLCFQFIPRWFNKFIGQFCNAI